MLCPVRAAAEEHEVVRRKDVYRRKKGRPGAGTRIRALGSPGRASLTCGDRQA